MIYVNGANRSRSAELVEFSAIKNCRKSRMIFACALFLIVASTANADAQSPADGGDPNPGEFGEIFGVGSMNCGQWISSSQTKQKGDDWILGWWTAAASDNSRLAANKANEKKILKETSELCQKDPGMALTNAVSHVFGTLERSKRRR